MDDIIQVIVILFIIFSFFSNALKKKPEKKDNRTKIQTRRVEPRKTASTQQPSPTDILEDLLGLKLPKTDGEYQFPNRGRDYEDEDIERESASLENSLPETEKQPKYASTYQDVDYDKIASMESTQETKQLEFDLNKVYDYKSLEHKKSFDIVKRIKNSSAIREAVLISEILNKPKSLRK